MRPESIDRLMPPMKCDEGCGECCGPVMCSQPEYERVEQYAAKHNLKPADNGIMRCPWFQDGGCVVYEARPTACRMFGHVEFMECPRGHSVNVKLSVENRIMKDIDAEINATATRLLHEAVDPNITLGEIFASVMEESK